jgi:hypothetical protein
MSLGAQDADVGGTIRSSSVSYPNQPAYSARAQAHMLCYQVVRTLLQCLISRPRIKLTTITYNSPSFWRFKIQIDKSV